jgi:hypothetical protein
LSVASVSAKCDGSTFETKWVRTLLTHHGRKASVACLVCPEDLDGDQYVGVNDLLIVLKGWGPC